MPKSFSSSLNGLARALCNSSSMSISSCLVASGIGSGTNLIVLRVEFVIDGTTKRSHLMDLHAQRAKGLEGRCKGQRIVQSLSKSRLNPKVPSLPPLPKYINTANCVTDEEAPALEDAEVLDEVEENKKRHLNVVFIGHVDAGKSTIGGQILFHSGQVYHFGCTCHKSYVPNMISGAAQADIGVLVISDSKGEFETGDERGGQTREHVQFAKTLGVSKLFVVVNKMDDPTVNWSQERYDEIESKMIPFLRSSGYNV
ncbi:hypothetical protein SLE2022_056840 [Rubroshorea leprosula]